MTTAIGYTPPVQQQYSYSTTINNKVEGAGDLVTAAQNGEVLALLLPSNFVDNAAVVTKLEEPVVESLSLEQRQNFSALPQQLNNTDVEQLEKIAASAATLLPVSHLQLGNKSAAAENTQIKLTTSGIGISANQMISHAPVAGSTDITAVNKAEVKENGTNSGYVNLFGDSKTLEVMNGITEQQIETSSQAKRQSAEFSQLAVAAAQSAGKNLVKAAVTSLAASIASGVTSTTLQMGSTRTAIKSLNKEKISIDTNLRQASIIEKIAQEHNHSVHRSSSELVTKGTRLDPNVEHGMLHSGPKASHESTMLRHKHNDVQLATQKTRLKTDLLNQAIKQGSEALNAGINIGAAQSNKEAELNRADEDVKKALANNEKELAEKAEQTIKSMQDLYHSMITNNQEVASAIVSNSR